MHDTGSGMRGPLRAALSTPGTEPSGRVIRVLIVDDERLLRQLLRAVLDQIPDIVVVGGAADGAAGAREAVRLAPDVVVMDLAMPGVDGVAATRLLSRTIPDARVLCVSAHADRARVRRALQAGAAGFAPKDCSPDELERAIRTLADGRCYVSPLISSIVIDLVLARPDERPSARLTRREQEVMDLLVGGLGTKEIARRLGISPKTVATHREHVLAKMGVRNVVELANLVRLAPAAHRD